MAFGIHRKIKILIIDDSAVARKTLQSGLERHPDIEVVGAAPDPFVAREMIVSLEPDVITLDIEMPRMDGESFLRKLMAAKPIPTIVVSSVAPAGSRVALACLEAGAFEVVAKPNGDLGVGETVNHIAELARAAVSAKPLPTAAKVAASPIGAFESHHQVIALGASTGGTEALRGLMKAFPAKSPGIVIVQHMPPGFTKMYAQALNDTCAVQVREANDGDYVVPGVALIAPGNKQMTLSREGSKYIVKVFDGPRVSGHCPSVDVLFQSVAKTAGKGGIGVLLTGMGRDGAKGLLNIREAGGHTIAQSERTCVVFGMPAKAIQAGAAEHVCDLQDIPAKVADLCRGYKARNAA